MTQHLDSDNYYDEPGNLADSADRFLGRESAAAAERGIGGPITLVVGGTPWVGQLTSPAEFARICASQMDALADMAATDQGAAQLVRSWGDELRTLGDELAAHVEHHKDRDDDGRVRSRYVHLTGARRAGDATVFPAIRFRITAVDGWTYGPVPQQG